MKEYVRVCDGEGVCVCVCTHVASGFVLDHPVWN